MDARLPTWIWIDALIRRADGEGASAFIVQKGDQERGGVLVKVATLDGRACVYAPRYDLEGRRVFVDLTAQGVGPEESEADAYLARERARDPDLWVIEIEDKAGRHFLVEPVEGGRG